MAIDETGLTKGLRRKLNALRKSVGDDLAEEVFAKWSERQATSQAKDKPDPVCQRRSKISPPGRSKSSPLSVRRLSGASNVRISAETGRRQPGIGCPQTFSAWPGRNFTNLGGLDPDRFARLRIAALARRTLGDGEGAEVADGVTAFLLRLLQPRLDQGRPGPGRPCAWPQHVAFGDSMNAALLMMCGLYCSPNRNNTTYSAPRSSSNGLDLQDFVAGRC